VPSFHFPPSRFLFQKRGWGFWNRPKKKKPPRVFWPPFLAISSFFFVPGCRFHLPFFVFTNPDDLKWGANPCLSLRCFHFAHHPMVGHARLFPQRIFLVSRACPHCPSCGSLFVNPLLVAVFNPPHSWPNARPQPFRGRGEPLFPRFFSFNAYTGFHPGPPPPSLKVTEGTGLFFFLLLLSPGFFLFVFWPFPRFLGATRGAQGFFLPFLGNVGAGVFQPSGK